MSESVASGAHPIILRLLGGMGVSEIMCDFLIQMQGKVIPKEKEKGFELSLALSALIGSISTDFRRRKLCYLNKIGIPKNLRMLALEGNLRIIIYYWQKKTTVAQRGKVAYLKCISIRTKASTWKYAYRGKKKNEWKRKRETKEDVGFAETGRESQRQRDGDTERGRIKKKLRKGREEASWKQKGCCTNMRKIYHGTYLTISHSSLSWFLCGTTNPPTYQMAYILE